MKHEARCIEIPCTCLTILRSRVDEQRATILRQGMENEIQRRSIDIYHMNNELLQKELEKVQADKKSNDEGYLALSAERNALEKHISQMSCCCAGCTKHNQDLKESSVLDIL